MCDKEEPNSNNRFRLFENVFSKTAACGRVEIALDTTVESLMHGAIICKRCEKDVTRITKNTAEAERLTIETMRLKAVLKANYERSLAAMKDTFGITTEKRMSHSTTPEKAPKRQQHDDKENIFRPPVNLYSRARSRNLGFEAPDKRFTNVNIAGTMTKASYPTTAEEKPTRVTVCYISFTIVT